MDKQTINPPMREHMTKDLKAELGIDRWWFILVDGLGDVLNEAVGAGMSPRQAQEAFKEVMTKALPFAMSVKGKESKDEQNETWVCMFCKSKLSIPKDRIDGQRCFICKGLLMPLSKTTRPCQKSEEEYSTYICLDCDYKFLGLSDDYDGTRCVRCEGRIAPVHRGHSIIFREDQVITCRGACCETDAKGV